MKPERILIFFITVLCIFCISGTAFASYTGRTERTYASIIAAGADGGAAATRLVARTEDARTGKLRSGLSTTHALPDRRYFLIDHSSEMFKVISVVKERVKDKRLLKKIEDKLPELTDSRLRMIVSLSERIGTGGRDAKKDFAFLLLTTLIVFS